MKQVKITITGDVIAVDYCSQSLYNEDTDFNDAYYLVTGWDKITGMYIDVPDDTYKFDNLENVVKNKGKYSKTMEFFHKLFGEESDHPLPVDVHTRTYYNQWADYIIELEDDEEFDIKKVQLVKSDYEVELFPYFIAAGYILYDGKEIYTNDTDEYCPEEKMHDEYVIEEFYN